MDYCSSCRRHLNGALVCPGCGAYAPDIAPPAHRVEGAPATATTREPYAAQPASGYETADAPGAGPSGDSEDVVPATPTGSGRAARRRQLARWKKHKRRAAAGTAIALVGGALTIAALPTGSRERPIAASAPESPTPDTARISHPAASSAQPDKQARQPHTRPSATTAPRQQPATDAVPPPTARTATPPAAPTAPAAAERPKTYRAYAPAPQPDAPAAKTTVAAPQSTSTSPVPPATAPASGDGTSGSSGTSVADRPVETSPAQTATTSPTQVCVLVLCLG